MYSFCENLMNGDVGGAMSTHARRSRRHACRGSLAAGILNPADAVGQGLPWSSSGEYHRHEFSSGRSPADSGKTGKIPVPEKVLYLWPIFLPAPGSYRDILSQIAPVSESARKQ